jgi:23S rRNA (cytidine1920-2'-O)/16S rRNA (cytidine1409-2'-O)-methyltransferase
MKDLYENIRSLRRFKGWKQETMAELLEMSTNAYANIEQGKTVHPNQKAFRGYVKQLPWLVQVIMHTIRLDQLLVTKGLTPSRQKAHELIVQGEVLVNGDIINKPSKKVSCEAVLTITSNAWQRVSRGGLKLEPALTVWQINPHQWICLDVGASTGGFTEVLLQRGAKKVYALDVGHGQLAAQLRRDPRVINLEGINARHLEPSLLPEPIDFCCIDVSFISLTLIIPEILKFLKPHSHLIALIKPQFEVGRAGIGKNGIVKDPQQHQLAINKIKELSAKLVLTVVGLIESPILGTGGNKEFLIYLRNSVVPTSQ